MYKAFGTKKWSANRFDKGSSQKFGYITDSISPAKKHVIETKKSVRRTQKEIIGEQNRKQRAKEYEAKMRKKNQSFITKMVNMFR